MFSIVGTVEIETSKHEVIKSFDYNSGLKKYLTTRHAEFEVDPLAISTLIV